MDSQITTQGSFLERLRQANEGQLETYLTQMVGSEDIARELVKDSFALVGKSRSEQAAFPRAVLFRVATNVALLYLRKRRAEQMGLAAVMEIEEVRAPDRDCQHRQLSADEYGANLALAIKALRLSHRKVFVMVHLQGKVRKDIAVALGISEARVDKRLTKALKAVRDHLSSRGIDPTDAFGLLAIPAFACILSIH